MVMKEEATQQFVEMIEKSWTYARLTEDEKKAFHDAIEWAEHQEVIKGNAQQRWKILNAIYTSFLYALGYNTQHQSWRD